MDIQKMLNEVINEESPSKSVARFARSVVALECNENTYQFSEKYDQLLNTVMSEEV